MFCVDANGKLVIRDSAGGQGSITDGYSDEPGGGIFNQGLVVLEGGKITGNKASCGAGIYNGNTGFFIMTGGEVCNNEASENGGGFFLREFDPKFSAAVGRVYLQ